MSNENITPAPTTAKSRALPGLMGSVDGGILNRGDIIAGSTLFVVDHQGPDDTYGWEVTVTQEAETRLRGLVPEERIRMVTTGQLTGVTLIE